MLPKKHRLSSTYEFNKVRKFGIEVKSKYFYLYYLNVDNFDSFSRVGIVVSNKFSKSAPARNRVKRIFREVVRNNLENINNGYWIVIHPRKITEGKKYEEINAEFNKVLSEIPVSS